MTPTSRGAVTTAGAALARAALLVLIPVLLLEAYDNHLYDGIGADIGAGVMWFAVMLIGSVLWSWADVSRRGWRSASVVWCAATVVGVVLEAARCRLQEVGSVSAALASASIVLWLVGVGAALGLALGAMTTRRRPPPTPER